MDEKLVLDVLNDALDKYDKPEIFNTDQESQYTIEKTRVWLHSGGHSFLI